MLMAPIALLPGSIHFWTRFCRQRFPGTKKDTKPASTSPRPYVRNRQGRFNGRRSIARIGQIGESADIQSICVTDEPPLNRTDHSGLQTGEP